MQQTLNIVGTQQQVSLHCPAVDGNGRNKKLGSDHPTGRSSYALQTEHRQTYRQYAKRIGEALRYGKLSEAKRLQKRIENLERAVSEGAQNGPGLGAEISCDERIRRLLFLMAEGKYEEAEHYGKRARLELDRLGYIDQPYFRAAQAELDVYYAQSLCYTGREKKGIRVLKRLIAEVPEAQKPPAIVDQYASQGFEDWRWNLVQGRAHNNLGYTSYMDLGQYGVALKEFEESPAYFQGDALQEERANTLDNEGRVYALFYNRAKAEKCMEQSLQMRFKLGDKHRIALGLNSRAIAHLQFKEFSQAEQLSRQALDDFKELGSQRGIGLACLTLGQALRGLSSLDNDYSPEERRAFLKESVKCFKLAVDIFEQRVCEPVRLIGAYKELGCTHHAWEALAAGEESESSQICLPGAQAIECLKTAIGLARPKNKVLYANACTNLAQVYFDHQDFDHAELWLQHAASAVPENHKARNDSELQALPLESRFEGLWHEMIGIELLRGHLAFNRALCSDDTDGFRRAATEAIRDYTFAIIQSKHYAPYLLQAGDVLQPIYAQLKQGKQSDIQYIREQILPNVRTTDKSVPSAYELIEEQLKQILKTSQSNNRTEKRAS